MSAVGKSVSVLAVALSVMAVVSLIYGLFTEPLEPYLKGLMGGTFELYVRFRSLVFSSLGSGLSVTVSFMRTWLTWLPPAPWFHFPDWGKDAATVLAIGSGSALRAQQLLSDADQKAKHSEDFKRLKKELINTYLFPIILFNRLFKANVGKTILDESEKVRTIELFVALTIIYFGYYCVGAGLFFLLAYGETQLGF